MNDKLIAPSILAADYMKFGEAIEALNRADCDWIHVDVMDGCFVPEISFGHPVIRAIRKLAKKPLDVHLMIQDPLPHIRSYAESGASRITFHIEAAEDPGAVIREIHSLGLPAAIALRPATPVSKVLPYLDQVEMVLIMTVEPGFGGQPILPETIEKIRELRRIIEERKLPVLLQADGGINMANAAELSADGLNVFVAGTAIFKGNPEENAAVFRKKILSGN